MTREQKYPNTDTFQYYNANPKNRITTDCVIRAICTALNQPYAAVVQEMANIQIETGYDDASDKGIELYLTRHGWTKHKQPRKADNTKYTGIEFCKSIAKKNERYVANIGTHHIVAIVDKKVYDIGNSTDGCIGIYYTK